MKRIPIFLFFSLFLLPLAPALAGDGIVLSPHRAIYNVKLERVKKGSPVSDVSGTMLYEVADSCDGWTTQQRMQMVFSFPEGGQSEVTSSVVSWEAKDGSSYRFNVKRLTDGREDVVYKGNVVREGERTVVHYLLPEGDPDKELSPDAIFPMAHTILILQKAKAGEKIFSSKVFDGSDEEGSSDSNMVIGMRYDLDMTFKADASDAYKALYGDQIVQPVRIAFYKPLSQTGEPDYEMELALLSTGVANSISIDYGDFSVTGTLAELQPVETPPCGGKN